MHQAVRDVKTIRRRTLAVAVAVLALVATACESVQADRINDARAAAGRAELPVDALLTESARAHSIGMCATGAVAPSEDLVAAHGVAAAVAYDELVARAPLDPNEPDAGRRNGAATTAIWAQWSDAPTIVDPQWDTLGVGEHECADGYLYMTLVLRNDPGPVAEPGTTDQISLVSSTTVDGWRYRHYRNLAYPCSISGYQTFTIATKVGSDLADPKPMWIYTHGGGSGYFAADGTPFPNTNFKVEEPAASLRAQLDRGEIFDAVRETPGGIRMLAVSMCNQDVYGGAGTLDPYNPNSTPDGGPRRVNGLLATTAAVRFSTTSFPTDDIVVHGTSAGASGALTVTWSLEEQGFDIAAVIADSGGMNEGYTRAMVEQGLCGANEEGTRAVAARIHPEILDPANQPHRRVADGRLAAPVLQLWTSADPSPCGTTPMVCPLADGTTVTMGAADCRHEPLRAAIEARTDGRSLNMRLCVDDPTRAGPCDQHVPTATPGATNSDPAWPTDFVTVVIDWARARVADA